MITSAPRAVVVDDGQTIWLTTYREAIAVGTVELDPLRALAVGIDLVEAAHRHLARHPPTAERRRRGQRSAETTTSLQQSNHAIATLRAEFFADLGITRASNEIATQGRRYESSGAWRADRDKPADKIDDDRHQLLAKVLHGRRHFPRARQIRAVLREVGQ